MPKSRPKKKSKYPEWFSVYTKPYAPSKPKPPNEFVDKVVSREVIYETTLTSDQIIDHTKLSDLDENTKLVIKLYHDYGHDYDCEYGVSLSKVIFQKEPNPSYEQEMEQYKKDLKRYEKEYATYKEQVAQWKVLAKQWEEEAQQEQEKRERREYERLKKKFG